MLPDVGVGVGVGVGAGPQRVARRWSRCCRWVRGLARDDHAERIGSFGA